MTDVLTHDPGEDTRDLTEQLRPVVAEGPTTLVPSSLIRRADSAVTKTGEVPAYRPYTFEVVPDPAPVPPTVPPQREPVDAAAAQPVAPLERVLDFGVDRVLDVPARPARGYVGKHRAFEPITPAPEPTRVWPNLIPRLLDRIGRGAS